MLEDIKKKAILDNIPIMLDDGISFLCDYIRNNDVKKILEIGTAVGYSSICMALINNSIHVDTIERDNIRYVEALKNIDLMNLSKQINCIYGDALEIDIDSKYDLIFIDGAKGQNVKFFDKYSKLLDNSGTIIVDNIYFHGVIYEDDAKLSRNLRQLKRKIIGFIDYIKSLDEYKIDIISCGDGIAVITKR